MLKQAFVDKSKREKASVNPDGWRLGPVFETHRFKLFSTGSIGKELQVPCMYSIHT